jgi:hypothetical protein
MASPNPVPPLSRERALLDAIVPKQSGQVLLSYAWSIIRYFYEDKLDPDTQRKPKQNSFHYNI